MSSVEYLREFINERLAAAADEIFGVFKNAVVEYEEEIDRQRRLLDIVWKPEIKLHRIEVPQQHVCKEKEVLSDQERSSSPDQEDPDPPQIKEEPCSSQEGEQLEVQQETEPIMWTPTNEESDHSEDETPNINPDDTIDLPVISSVASGPESDHQLLSHDSHTAESQDHKQAKKGDSRSAKNAEPTVKKRRYKRKRLTKSHSNPTTSKIDSNAPTDKTLFQCETCDKRFKYKSQLQSHLIAHSGERSDSCSALKCDTCDKEFIYPSSLIIHLRTHSGEKPFCCKTCGNRFSHKSALNSHLTIHTGEKPHSCKTCGRAFRLSGNLRVHMRIHTGEKPHSCNVCGKRFSKSLSLNIHKRIHTGEKVSHKTATMSSVVSLRKFVNERLSAAAEEIFGVFEKTIVEYQEEIHRQSRLLNVFWKPEIKLQRIELPQQHVCKEEEVLSDQQLCIQERSSSLDQEDPDPPQIKEEQEELCTSQEGEQLELQQETETFMLTPTYEESNHTEAQTPNINPDDTIDLPVISSVASGPESDHQLLSHDSHTAESQDHKQAEKGDSRSTKNAEPTVKKRRYKRKRLTKSHSNPTTSKIDSNAPTGQKTIQCAMCNKTFKYKSHLQRHLIVHTGDLPHSYKTFKCGTCGKAFIYQSNLLMHLRTHSGEKPYSCNTCGKRFSQKSSLNSHMRIHTGEKPYSCKTCGRGFSQTSALNTHTTIHTGEKPHSCKVCGRAFRLSGDLTVHMKIHTGEKPFTCLLCGKTFRLGGDLAVHMRRPHNATMSSVVSLRKFVNERLSAAAEEIFGVFEKTIVEYQEEIHRQSRLLNVFWKPEIKLQRIELPQQHVCKEEEVLSDQQLCIQERSSSLDQEDPDPPQIKEEQEEVELKQEGEQLEVQQETETFILTPIHEKSNHTEPEPTSENQLLSDNSHVAESPDQKGSEHEDSESTRDSEPEPKKRHQKSRRRNNVNKSNVLDSHDVTHTGKQTNKCDTCGKEFKYKSELQRHMGVHTGEKPYVCKTCGKDFSRSTALKVHMRIHTGEKPFVCKTCGKRFRESSIFKAHVRTHTGEKPHSCKTCEKRFNHLSALKIHIRIHTGEKPYPCETCGKGFKSASDLKIHMRIHTGEKPYGCKTCEKRFCDISPLIRHMRTHTGEKPYACGSCGKAFVRGSSLKSHMKTHAVQKSLTCTTCGRDFRKHFGLLTHMRKAHPGEKPLT
ncbi:zinc finger protein 420-like [Cebidichthys violaceus]|uniref:zinc finger protein 420-like n=1 Tax=Cebidichthys violaceus TaxID=271503 RepID=UPI0035C9761F